MLTLITLMILAALAIGGANFRTVTNMQFRDEAIAAANRALDQVMGTPFAIDTRRPKRSSSTSTTTARMTTKSISPMPQCITRHARREHSPEQPVAAAGDVDRIDVEHGLGAPGDGSGSHVRYGDVNAGEAAVDVRTGVRVLLSGAQKDAVCT